LHDDLKDNSYIAYAGVSRDEDGKLLATGGRVLVCVGLGDSIIGKKCRIDIAYQALED